jgi:hypothetical protein
MTNTGHLVVNTGSQVQNEGPVSYKGSSISRSGSERRWLRRLGIDFVGFGQLRSRASLPTVQNYSLGTYTLCLLCALLALGRSLQSIRVLSHVVGPFFPLCLSPIVLSSFPHSHTRITMVRLREITRTAAFAWSPDSSAPWIATGTKSGAVDVDFSNETCLELWDLALDEKSQGELKPAATINTETG